MEVEGDFEGSPRTDIDKAKHNLSVEEESVLKRKQERNILVKI